MNYKTLLAFTSMLPFILSASTVQSVADENNKGKNCIESKTLGSGRPNKMRSMANMNAIIDWMNVTKKKHGQEYTQWHSAIDKSVKCRKAGDFNICIAEGKPCKMDVKKSKGT